MDKRMHIRDLIHLLGLSVILFVYYLFLREIFLFEIILLLFVWEIIVNLKYPVEHFPRYYLVNALGVLIFMSIIIFRQRGEIWFDWHWLLSYQGIALVMLAPLFGYGVRRMLTDRKQTIYLAHMLVPGMLLLLIKVASQGSIAGGTLIMVLFIIIMWQIFGSNGITTRNFWKFYLANAIGLVLFLIVFSYEQFLMLSLQDWLTEYGGALSFMPIIPMIGLFAGLLRENVNVRPEGDGQGVKQDEKTNYMEKR